MPHANALAQIFAERMLNGMVEGLAIALFGWILLRALGRQNSSTRFAVWFLALLAIAALPFFETNSLIAPNSLSAVTHSAIRLPVSWAFDIFILWAMIASAGLLRIGFGFWQLRKLRQSCVQIDATSLPSVLKGTLAEFGVARGVTVCTSDRVFVPTALGFLKPAIVIPSWALRELSPLELNTVLLHELAHLRRWDDWTNLTQRILRALLFFHPAVWWIGHGLSIEREMACDDSVLAATSNPRAYAQCLVSVAEKSFLRRSLALAQAAVGRMRQTTQRVARILDAERPAATKVWKPAIGLVATFSAVCLLSVPRAPRLVAFEDQLPSRAASAPKAAPADAVDAAARGAKMIPAALRSRASNRPLPENDVARTVRLRQQNRSAHFTPAPIPVKSPQSQSDSPRLVRTSANSPSEGSAPDSLLLIMRTEQVDESGQMIFSVSVWRLTVFHPVDRQQHTGVIPKST